MGLQKEQKSISSNYSKMKYNNSVIIPEIQNISEKMQSQLVNEELEKKNIAVNLGGMTSMMKMSEILESSQPKNCEMEDLYIFLQMEVVSYTLL